MKSKDVLQPSIDSPQEMKSFVSELASALTFLRRDIQSFWIILPMSVLLVALPVLCYWAAEQFHWKYVAAHSEISKALREAHARGDGDLTEEQLARLPSPTQQAKHAGWAYEVARFACILGAALGIAAKGWVRRSIVLVAEIAAILVTLQISHLINIAI